MRLNFANLADLRSRVGKTPVLVAAAALALLAATWIPGAFFDRSASTPAVTHQGGSTPQAGADSARTVGRSDRSDPFDGPGAAVDITLKLLAVLALVYVALAALRKYSLGAGLGRSARAVQVVECTNLAANRSLYIVNVEGKRLLIGVTASSMATLAELDPTSPEPERIRSPHSHHNGEAALPSPTAVGEAGEAPSARAG